MNLAPVFRLACGIDVNLRVTIVATWLLLSEPWTHTQVNDERLDAKDEVRVR